MFKLFNKYFIPTLLGMLSMSAVTAIDGIFVGHGVGSDGVAAINICIPVLMLLMGVALMLGAGCSVVASIHLARGKQRVARMNVTQTLVFATLITLVPSVVIMLFPDTMGRLLGSSDHLLPLVKDYLRWFIPSLLFEMWMAISLFIIRLDGAPKLAMWCNIIPAAVNIMLDWLFIFPLGLGVTGAAAATTISLVICVPSNSEPGITCPNRYTGSICWSWLKMCSAQWLRCAGKRRSCFTVQAPRFCKRKSLPGWLLRPICR